MSEPEEDPWEEMPYFCADCHCVGEDPHRPYCPEKDREDAAIFGPDDDGGEWDEDADDPYDDEDIPCA